MILPREDGKTQPEIAALTGVSLSIVNRAHMAYDNGGVNALRPKSTGAGGTKIWRWKKRGSFSLDLPKPLGLPSCSTSAL
jgi:hypothetical protein